MSATTYLDNLQHWRIALKNRWARALVSLCMFGLPLGAGLAVGYSLGYQQADALDRNTLEEDAAADTDRLRDLNDKVVSLEARIGRLDVIGEQVADVAQVELSSLPPTAKLPAVGGPNRMEAEPPQPSDIYSAIDRLAQRIGDREQQFDNLQSLLANRSVGEAALYGARPVLRGEISSYFGMRIDPVSGARSMHEGVDFSGKPGTAIMAAADGVVTFAADKQGYGRLIEINHGNDCFTRYAHSKLIFVRQGDVVRKGQVIALMGSSGRATGTHLHFEVYKHGRPIDPFIYLSQASL